jgi:ATP-dependent DNA ligase
LGYYTDDGKLIYAGRVGTGMPDKVLGDLRRRLNPLARASSPLSTPLPRKKPASDRLSFSLACIGLSRSSLPRSLT